MPGGKKPDFVVELDGEHFIVEATVLLDPEGELRSEARQAPVLDGLQQLETSSYWIDVEVVAEGPDLASGRRLCSQVQEWIDGLDPSTVEEAPKVSTSGCGSTVVGVSTRSWGRRRGGTGISTSSSSRSGPGAQERSLSRRGVLAEIVGAHRLTDGPPDGRVPDPLRGGAEPVPPRARLPGQGGRDRRSQGRNSGRLTLEHPGL